MLQHFRLKKARKKNKDKFWIFSWFFRFDEKWTFLHWKRHRMANSLIGFAHYVEILEFQRDQERVEVLEKKYKTLEELSFIIFKILLAISTLSGLKRVIIDHLKEYHKVRVPINKNPQKSATPTPECKFCLTIILVSQKF